MAPQSYSFFGLGPGQMQAPVDPNILALQQFNNDKPSNQSGGGGGGMMGMLNPQMLAQMMMQNKVGTGAATAMNPSGAEGMLNPTNGGNNG